MRRIANIAILLALSLTPVYSQTTAPAWRDKLTPGMHLRIHARPDVSRTIVGSLIGISTASDTVLLADESWGGTRTIAIADILRMERRAPPARHIRRGIFFGLLAGGGFGGLMGLGCTTGCFGADMMPGIFGGIGAIVGGLVGAIPSESWVTILPPLTLRSP